MSITLLTMGALSQDALKESQKPLVDALNLAIGNKGLIYHGFTCTCIFIWIYSWLDRC